MMVNGLVMCDDDSEWSFEKLFRMNGDGEWACKKTV